MKYDAIVIGLGQAGNPLCFRLADLGWRVALIEKFNLGGTCINTGCTPTKTMVASARAAHVARTSARLGVHVRAVEVDLGQIVDRKDAVMQSWRSSIESSLAAAGVASLALFDTSTAAVEALHLRVADIDRDLLALEASLTGDGK